MRDLPLALLRSLAAVRFEGGVRPAAKKLAVEHSTISRALRDLEKWMGLPIVAEGRRGQALRLTPEGEVLADEALAAMRSLDLATTKLKEARSSNRVVLAAPPSIANRWLLPRLARIEAECAGVELSITVDTVRMGALDPHADLSIRMGARTVSNAVVEIIGSDIAFPVIGKQAWEKAGLQSGTNAVAKFPLLHDRDARTAWSVWRDAFGPCDLDVVKGARFTSADLVLRAAEQGRGLALTRGWLAKDALKEQVLVRPFNELSIPLKDEWWIAWPDNASPKRSVRNVRDWLIAEGSLLTDHAT